MTKKFNSEEDEVLINLVKQYPAIYNCKLKSYKDVVVKNNIWKTIATNLKKSESDCRSRWKNIRDYYKRKRNEAVKLTGTGSQRSDNDFFLKFKHLLFLEETAIMDRETISSVDTDEIRKSESTADLMGKNLETTKQTVIPETITGESLIPASQDPLVETHKNVNSQEEKVMKPRKKNRISNENILAEVLKKNNEERTVLIRELLQSSQSQLNPTIDPAISMFFQSIAATVSKFTPQLQARAKSEVMNVVAQLEFQNIHQQNSENNYPNTNFTQFSNTRSQSRPYSSTESSSFSVNNFNTPIYTENSFSFSLPLSSCNSSDENLGPDCVH